MHEGDYYLIPLDAKCESAMLGESSYDGGLVSPSRCPSDVML